MDKDPRDWPIVEDDSEIETEDGEPLCEVEIIPELADDE